MFFLRLMGNSEQAMFFYDHCDVGFIVKMSLLLYTAFGSRFCTAVSQLWTCIALSVAKTFAEMMVALLFSYGDLFKDCYLAWLIWDATLKYEDAWTLNSAPVVMFISIITSVVLSEFGKAMVLISHPEFYTWYFTY